MATSGYRVCPGCGLRNKPKWETCARCGELLGDVSVARTASTPSAPPGGGGDRPGAVSVASVGLLMVAGLAFALLNGRQPAVPAAEAFTIPTMPPSARPVAQAVAQVLGESASFERGRLALLQGNVAEAVRLLGVAVSEAPESAVYRSHYAKALWQSGARTEAVAQHEAAVRLNAGSIEYRVDLAIAYASLERPEDAAREFARVLEAEPGQLQALRGLARLKSGSGDASQAAALLRRAVQLRGSDPEVIQELAFVLEQAGQLEDARGFYAGILARLPDAQITRGRLAETLLAQGRPADAVRLLEEGVQRTPAAPLLRRSLASLLERTGDLPGAIAAYREYVRLAPNAEDAKTLELRAASLERRQAAAPATQDARVGS